MNTIIWDVMLMVRVDARASVRAFMPAYLRDNGDVDVDDETRWDDVDDDMIMMMMLQFGSFKMPQMTRQRELILDKSHPPEFPNTILKLQAKLTTPATPAQDIDSRKNRQKQDQIMQPLLGTLWVRNLY